MLSSQRCSKQIYELANYLIDWSKTQDDLSQAFLDLKMLPVEDKNPDIPDGLNFNILENAPAEKEFVLNEINKRLSQNPNLTIGVLVKI
ncbi:MAG: hypothetical protein MZW92_75420 [Comamonadaceae bacterium]|nr:hypothetical protein [Comamonadaceae bacterium]